MCQLFALNCNVPSAVTFSFTGLSARGGRTDQHADGFGLAFHDDAACRLFIDDHRASDAPLADFLRRHPIRARTVLAHLRKATQGAVQLSNCHPFVREWQGRTWSFCHNGDLAGFHPRLTGHYLPVGTTDSERAFCWILQELRRRIRTRSASGWRRLAPVIAELAATIARHGAFNFLLSDGAALYAHCSSSLFSLVRSDPFPTAQLVDDDMVLDLGAINGRGSRMVLLATEPLTRNENWQPLQVGELQVYADGERVWTGAQAADTVVPPAVVAA
jgi:glutamine amidotransferase